MRHAPDGQVVAYTRGYGAGDGPLRIVLASLAGTELETLPAGHNPRWCDRQAPVGMVRLVCESPDGVERFAPSSVLGAHVHYVPANRGQLDAEGQTLALSDLSVTTVDNGVAATRITDARDPRLARDADGRWELAARHATGDLFLHGGPVLGPATEHRWSSETLLWAHEGQVWGRSTPDQPTTLLTPRGHSVSHPLPYWDAAGQVLYVGLVLAMGKVGVLWLFDWGALAAHVAAGTPLEGFYVGQSAGAGFDWSIRRIGPMLHVAFLDPTGVIATRTIDPRTAAWRRVPPAIGHVDWSTVPVGTTIRDGVRRMFGPAPCRSTDGRRVYLPKNTPPEAEWRELTTLADGNVRIDHLWDQSRHPGDPGWYLYDRDACLWGFDRFTSGVALPRQHGEMVEADGRRVRWTHIVTLSALVNGGLLDEFDPRFPGQDYGPDKGYERQYTAPDGHSRWEYRYTPIEAKGVIPWGDPSMDVIEDANDSWTNPFEPQLPVAYVECPRLSCDADPAFVEPEPEPEPPPVIYTPVPISDAEFSQLAARLEKKYNAPPAAGGLGRGPTETFVDQLGASRWRRDYFYNRDTGAQPDQAWRAVNNGINAVVGYPPGLDPNFPGQPVTPGDPLVALHIDGTTFRRPDNSIWKDRMVTGFDAFQRFLAGNDLTEYANWTRSVGGNGWRFFYTWVITGFNPIVQLGPQALTRELEAFRRWMDSQSLYSHNTALCDQVAGSSVLLARSQQDQLVDIIVGVMQGRHVEIFNEAWKNDDAKACATFAPERFRGTFASRTSWRDGEAPDVYGSVLDWTGEHNPRDAEWPRKAKNMLETSVQGIGAFPPTKKPAAGTEPIGIFEKEVPGSRTNNPSDVADYFAVAELFSSGACLHGDGATLQRCQLPGPQAQQCAEWALAARQAIPADAQLGSYVRGQKDGGGECPIEHSDDKALRTFFMLQGNRGTGVVVRPTADWKAIGRNGWRVDSIEGPNGHIVKVSR